MPSIITCCKDCKNRYLGCHQYCEEYLNQSKKLKQFKKKYKKYKDSCRADIKKTPYELRLRYAIPKREKGENNNGKN